MTEPTPPDAAGPARGRRIAVTTLVVVAGIMALLAVFAIWADRQVTENRSWRSTAETLIEDKAVRELLAAQLTDTLYEHVNVAGRVSQALPPRLAPLAAPAAGMLRERIQVGIDDALQRPAVQRAFVDAVGRTQTRVMEILDGDAPVSVDDDGAVTLDLRQVLIDVGSRVGFGAQIDERLPADAGVITLVQSKELETTQTALKLLKRLSIVLPVVALLLIVAALGLAAGRRREALRLLGIVLLVAGLLVPVLRAVAGDIVLDAVNAAPAAEEAADHTWQAGTSLLSEGGHSLVLYGLVVLLAAFLAGPSAAAQATRRHLRAVADPHWAYPLGVLVIVLVLWWAPTQSLQRWFPALILIGLLAVGMESLRRQVAAEAAAAGDEREGPDLRGTLSGLGEQVGRLRDRVRRTAEPTATDAAAGAGDTTAQLERLAELHRTGQLDDGEYQAAKTQILKRPE